MTAWIKRGRAIQTPHTSQHLSDHCINVAQVLYFLSMMMHATLYASLSENRESWIIARNVSCARHGTYAIHMQPSHRSPSKKNRRHRDQDNRTLLSMKRGCITFACSGAVQLSQFFLHVGCFYHSRLSSRVLAAADLIARIQKAMIAFGELEWSRLRTDVGQPYRTHFVWDFLH